MIRPSRPHATDADEEDEDETHRPMFGTADMCVLHAAPLSHLIAAMKLRDVMKSLTGILPVYKDSSLHHIDLMDCIRLTLAFELDIDATSPCFRLDCFPRLRKEEAGIVHITFGAQAKKDLSILKHAEFGYHVRAQLGERMPRLASDGITSKPHGEHVLLLSDTKTHILIPFRFDDSG